MDSRRSTLSAIVKRMSVLLGGTAVATASHATAVPAKISRPIFPNAQVASTTGAFKVPAKLILKQKQGGFRMIAQHDSHSSHASHASHASHSSHSSSAF